MLLPIKSCVRICTNGATSRLQAAAVLTVAARERENTDLDFNRGGGGDAAL
jgi:hypothetical protein